MVVDVLALGVLFVLLYRKKWNRESLSRRILHVLMFVYLTSVLYLTLMPILTALPFVLDHPYIPMDMVLFDDYIHQWGDAERQILLNVLLMIPFGFLYPQLAKGKCRMLRAILLTFLLSLSIELLQPLLHVYRASDITDVVTNTTGGLFGSILWLIFHPLSDRIWDWLDRKFPTKKMETT